MRYRLSVWLAWGIVSVFFSLYDGPELLLRVHWVVPARHYVLLDPDQLRESKGQGRAQHEGCVRRRPSSVHDVVGGIVLSLATNNLNNLNMPIIRVSHALAQGHPLHKSEAAETLLASNPCP